MASNVTATTGNDQPPQDTNTPGRPARAEGHPPKEGEGLDVDALDANAVVAQNDELKLDLKTKAKAFAKEYLWKGSKILHDNDWKVGGKAYNEMVKLVNKWRPTLKTKAFDVFLNVAIKEAKDTFGHMRGNAQQKVHAALLRKYSKMC